MARRVRRMNCSLSCFRRLLGTLSLGRTKRSRGGTWSPISCISPSTIHHSDFPSALFLTRAGDLVRLLGGPAPLRNHRSWCAAARRYWGDVWSRFARESIASPVMGLVNSQWRSAHQGFWGVRLKTTGIYKNDNYEKRQQLKNDKQTKKDNK